MPQQISCTLSDLFFQNDGHPCTYIYDVKDKMTNLKPVNGVKEEYMPNYYGPAKVHQASARGSGTSPTREEYNKCLIIQGSLDVNPLNVFWQSH